MYPTRKRKSAAWQAVSIKIYYLIIVKHPAGCVNAVDVISVFQVVLQAMTFVVLLTDLIVTLIKATKKK